MSAAAGTVQPTPAAQMGGAGGTRMPVLDEIQEMSGHFLLLFLVLVSVYVSRIPTNVLSYFRSRIVQFVALSSIFLITAKYGWIHGILAALAVALVITRALREESSAAVANEGMIDYVPAALIMEESGTTFVPQNHRWFVEKVLGENPFLIREKEVQTTAVQDLSERSMGSSNVSR
jgi:hypothetical protein